MIELASIPADDPVLADDGYPSDVELVRIRTWPLEAGWHALMSYVHARWAYAEQGYWRQAGDRYDISTAGWSGNEAMIGALSEVMSGVFWGLSMFSHQRGGHYILDVRNFGPDGTMLREPATPLFESVFELTAQRDEAIALLRADHPANPWQRATPAEGEVTTDEEPWLCVGCSSSLPYVTDRTKSDWWNNQPGSEQGQHAEDCRWQKVERLLAEQAGRKD